MNYKGNQHLKWEDRLSLERMLKIKTPKPKIAEALGVCLKTVYNEIARGMCEQLTSELEPVSRYCADVAERKYQEHLRAKGPDIERMKGTNRISLLQRFGFTEQMAYDLCKEYGLLSPTYSFSRRGGCWFCPNQGYSELAHTKIMYPELWEELRRLNEEKNIVPHGFKYGKSLEQVEALIEIEIRNQQYEAQQQTLFDILT